MELHLTDSVLHHVDKFSCRACLKSGGIGIMHAFNDTADCSDGEKELRDVYQKLTSIEVHLSDEKLPTLICGSCTNKLVTAYEFILDAQRAEDLLSIHFKNSAILQNSEPDLNDINIEIVACEETDLKEYKIEFMGTERIDDSEEFHHFESLDASDVNEVELDCEMIDEAQDDRKSAQNKSFEEFELLHEESDVEDEILSDIAENATNKKVGAIGSRLVSGTKHQINCDKCQRGFAKLESYYRHKAIAHTFAPREEIIAKQTSEQNILCPFCPRTFVHKNDLIRHVNAIHPEDAAKNPIEVESRTQKRQYKKATCPHCQKDFPQASIKIHIRRHLGINPYKCEICDKAFPRKQDLTVHIRQHTGERPHVCSVCGKSFIRPNKLSRHMRIHLGIRPYNCDECGKCFSQSNDLKIHQRRHTGEKPYACYCGESFISGTALRQHRKQKMHTEEDMPDPYDACRVNTRNKNLVQSSEILEIEKINE